MLIFLLGLRILSLSLSIILVLFFIKCNGFLNESICKFFNFCLFSIKFSTSLKIFSDVTFSKIIGDLIVSGSPPLFEIITAFPRDPASKEDLPNGSSHEEGTTVIIDLL